MSLTLHFHPLASFCWKVLIALYENDTPFEPVIVDLGEEQLARGVPEAVAAWARFPVLQDSGARPLVPESRSSSTTSTSHYPGRSDLHPGRSRTLPARPGSPTSSTTATCTSRCRRSSPTRIRPEGSKDPYRRRAGARHAGYRPIRMIDEDMRGKQWARARPSRSPIARPFPRCSTPTRSSHSPADPSTAAAISSGCRRGRRSPRVLSEAKPYMPMFPFYRPEED